MTRSDRSHTSLALAVTTGLLVLLSACGVDAGPAASGLPGPVDPTTTTLPDCPDDGVGTGGAIGSGNPDLACKAPTPPDPGPTTPDPDPNPDPDPTSTTIGGSDPDEDAYVEAMIESLAKGSDADLAISPDQAACIGPEWVDRIGVQEMSDAGIAPDDLLDGDVTEQLKDVIDRTLAEDLVGVMSDCGFDAEQVIIDGIVKGADLSPEEADCFVGRLPDGFGEQLLIVGLDGGTGGLDADPDLGDAIRDTATACQ